MSEKFLQIETEIFILNLLIKWWNTVYEKSLFHYSIQIRCYLADNFIIKLAKSFQLLLKTFRTQLKNHCNQCHQVEHFYQGLILLICFSVKDCSCVQMIYTNTFQDCTRFPHWRTEDRNQGYEGTTSFCKDEKSRKVIYKSFTL